MVSTSLTSQPHPLDRDHMIRKCPRFARGHAHYLADLLVLLGAHEWYRNVVLKFFKDWRDITCSGLL